MEDAATSGYLAVDVGGTKLEVGVVSENREIVFRTRTETPTSRVWSALAPLVDEACRWSEVNRFTLRSCGAGCGGPMDLSRRVVSPLHIPEWRDVDLAARLHDVTGLETIVDNDAKALVRAEWWHRVVHRPDDVPRSLMSVVIGTGVGAGILVDGRLLHGRTGNAGHIGHVVVEPDGNPCECGARGCLEAHVSGRALSLVTSRHPHDASSILRRQVGRWLGIAIASTAAVVDLVDVTLGGSVSLGFGNDFCEHVQAVAREHAGLDGIHRVTVTLVADGADAPLLGAAALAKYPSPYAAHVLS